MQVDTFEHIIRSGTVIFEAQVMNMDVCVVLRQRFDVTIRIFFVLLRVNLIHAIEADTDVLPLVDEIHQLLDGAVQLSDDVLNR